MHIKGAPATDAERATIAQMHADGASRNQIVTATGLGAGTVSKIARDLGLSFDVARVAPATAIRTAGFKVRRQAIQGRLLARAETQRRERTALRRAQATRAPMIRTRQARGWAERPSVVVVSGFVAA